MASQDNSVQIEVAAQTSGTDRITALEKEIRTLESSLEQTSKGAEVLAGLRLELETIGKQQAAISNFKALKTATEEAKAAFDAAQAKAQTLGAELAQTTTASATQTRQFTAARKEVNATQEAWEKSVTALQTARTALDAAGIDSKQLAAAQVTLKGDIKNTQQQLSELKAALASAGQSLGSARLNAEQTGQALESAFKTLGVRSVQAVETEINQLRSAMQTIRQSGSMFSADTLAATDAFKTKIAALEAELKGVHPASATAATGVKSVGASSAEAQAAIGAATTRVLGLAAAFAGLNGLGDLAKNVISTGASFETLRVRLEQLLGSQEKAVDAFEMIKKLAATTPFEVSNLTDTFIKLSSFGLKPTESQMRALSDAAAAAGGGQQMLERVSLALGQAWAKQKLQGDELLQLTEAGIPVWDLLAKATGRNVDELRHMSEAGTLGRDVILKLWDAIGEKNAGASARLMKTFSGTVSNAKDAMAEFFDLIARSGVLDYLTKQVQAVLDNFDKLKANGTLDKWAKDISTAVTITIDVIKNAISIVGSFSDIIVRLMEVMVVKKIIDFGVALSGLGAAATTAGAGATAAATGITAVGASAGIATTAANGLKAAMAFLWASAPVALVVAAIGFVASKLTEAKQRADEGDEAVRKMLSQPGNGATKKAVEDVGKAAAESSKEFSKLKSEVEGMGGPALKAKLDEFIAKMREIRGPTKDVQDGLVAIGIAAAKSLGVDTDAATKKVTSSFKDSTDALEVLIKTFPNLTAAGLNATALVGEAMKKMIDSAQTKGELDIIQAKLKELGQRGYQTGEQVADGMKLAAEKGEDLKQQIARWGLGFADLAKAAGKAGVDIDELTKGFDRKFANSIKVVNDLGDALYKTGNYSETAKQKLSEALDQQLNAANTVKEVELVIQAYQRLGARGQLTGEELTKGLDKARDKLDDMREGVNSLREAYHQLGLKTPEELQKIAAANAQAWDKVKDDARISVADLQKAFQQYADSAIAAAGEAGKAQVQSILEAEAAAKGLNVTFDETGKAIVKAMGTGATAINNARGYMDAFQRSALAATQAMEAQNAELERTISAQEKANELAERALELERKRKGVDKDGFVVDRYGNRMQINVPTRGGVFEQAKGRGLSEAQALGIANQFIGEDGSQIGWERTGKTWGVALNEAIEKIILANAAKAANQSNQEGPQQQPQQQQRSTKHTVNINLGGGRQQEFNMESANDASNLSSFLQQLEGAKKSAGY